MSKKHYVLFAWILVKNMLLYRDMKLNGNEDFNEGFRRGSAHALMKMQVDLEYEFANDNPNFNRDKFRKYIRENTR